MASLTRIPSVINGLRTCFSRRLPEAFHYSLPEAGFGYLFRVDDFGPNFIECNEGRKETSRCLPQVSPLREYPHVPRSYPCSRRAKGEIGGILRLDTFRSDDYPERGMGCVVVRQFPGRLARRVVISLFDYRSCGLFQLFNSDRTMAMETHLSVKQGNDGRLDAAAYSALRRVSGVIGRRKGPPRRGRSWCSCSRKD